MDLAIDFRGMKANASSCALVQEGRVLIAHITWADEGDRGVLEKALASIKFE